MMVALWILTFLCLVLVCLTELPAGWDRFAPLPYVLALTPFLWIPMTILVIIGIILGAWQYVLVSAFVLAATLMRGLQYHANNMKAPNTAQWLANRLAEKKARQQRAEQRKKNHTKNDPSVSNSLASSTGEFAVMTLNCRYGRASATEIVNAVRERDIAVLALQEMSTKLVSELDDAGLGELLPYRQLGDAQNTDNGGFNGLFTRVKPESSTPNGISIPAAEVPVMTIPLSDTQAIMFASAHPKSPMRSCVDWSNGIIELSALATAVKENNKAYHHVEELTPATTFTGKPRFTTGSVAGESFHADSSSDHAAETETETEVRVAAIGDRSRTTVEMDESNEVHLKDGAQASEVSLRELMEQRDRERNQREEQRPERELIAVVMGDLNSSTVHPSFRKLLNSGFRDAILVQATGEEPTFPSWTSWPRIVLDHILFTGLLTPKDVESFVVDGSDHLALTGTFRTGSRGVATSVPEIVRNRPARES